MKDFQNGFDLSLIDEVIIWSDGPSAEFKNQFVTGKLLHELMMVFEKPYTWKYFETSHGKGISDGIGGALRARVTNHANINTFDATKLFTIFCHKRGDDRKN